MRWEIRHNLMIFFISFPVKGTCEGVFLLKLQAVFTNCNFAKDELLLRFFFELLTKSVEQSLLDGHFYLLLSLKLFSEKKFY